MPAARKPAPSRRALLNARAHELLALLEQGEPAARVETGAAADEFGEVYVTFCPRLVPHQHDLEQPALKAAERRIVEACSAKPLTFKQIAGKLGRKNNTYLQGQVNGLWQRGVLVKLPGGFLTAQRPT